MRETRAVALIGGGAIGGALTIAGWELAGLAGLVVGFLLTLPTTMVWGYWWGSR